MDYESHDSPVTVVLNRNKVLARAGVNINTTGSSNANGECLVFHVLSWHGMDDPNRSQKTYGDGRGGDGGEDDVDDDDDDDDEEEDTSYKKSQPAFYPYIIRAFGVRESGRSVALTLTGFTPFFYLKFPMTQQPREAHARSQDMILQRIESECRRMAPDNHGGGFKGVALAERGDFWGFNNYTKYTFLRLSFGSHFAMKRCAGRFKNGSTLEVRGVGSVSFQLYESHIDPMLRFFHIREVKPAGWVSVRVGRGFMKCPVKSTTCNTEFECPWTLVTGLQDKESMAPIVLAGFDIECNSAHGDFPQPKKDYRKLATDLDQAWDRLGLKNTSEYDAKNALITCMRGSFWGPAALQQLVIGDRDVPLTKEEEAAAADAEDAAEDTEKQKAANAYVGRGNMALLKLKTSGLTPLTKGGKQIDTTINRVVDDIYQTLKRGVSVPASNSAANSSNVNKSSGDEDEDDASANLNPVVSRLLAIVTGAFGRRWPLQGDEVIQIGTTLSIVGHGDGSCATRVIYTLGGCSPDPAPAGTGGTLDPEGANIIVKSFSREEDMLIEWVDLVRAIDPDILIGYNIFGFDLSYLYERAVELLGTDECTKRFLRLGRMNALPSAYVEQTLSSSALGDNTLKYLDMHGRVLIDLMKVVQRDYKLDSFKLDNVAAHFLKMRKHDVSPQDVFRLQRGSDVDRRVIAEYCVQDCELCNRLAAKLSLVANNMGMANVCSVPLSFIFMRGQGVKIFSLVAKQCRLDHLLIPVRERPAMGSAEAEEGYEGAIVLEPQTGMYLDDPVSVLDYNSLYPSSMISHNLSHDSLVLDMEKYGAIPGVDYQDVLYDLYEGKGDQKHKVGVQTCRFVQGRGGKREPSVLPRILQRLLAARKSTRKRMTHVRLTLINDKGDQEEVVGELKAGKGGNSLVEFVGSTPTGRTLKLTQEQADSASPAYSSFECAVLDGLQLAYKVTANSLYGQMGARTSALYLKHVAACTTAVGRQMIMVAKSYVESPEVGGKVVYGDSVPGYTPIMIRVNKGAAQLCCIDEIANKYGVQDPRGGPRWAIMSNPTKVSCEIRTMPHDPSEFVVETWTQDGWTRIFRVIRHVLHQSKKIVRIETNLGLVDVTDDHSLLRPDGSPVSPKDVAVGDCLLAVKPPACFERNTQSTKDWGSDFVPVPKITHHYEFDRDNNKTMTLRMSFGHYWASSRAQLGAAVHYHQLFASASQDPEHPPEPDVVSMTTATNLGNSAMNAIPGVALIVSAIKKVDDSRRSRSAVITAIRKLDKFPEGEFVYDLTTENHQFSAGVGQLVVHNTDSIFVVFNNVKQDDPAVKLKDKEALASSIQQGQNASRGIAPLLPAPHNLEYEKTFFPLILLSKKRYVGLLYENDAYAKPYQKSMGIALKRRDYAVIVKKIYGGVLDILLNDRDVPRSAEFLKKGLEDLADGKANLSDLVISKTLAASYKNPTRIAHWVLARRMYERDPGSAPQVNDRIPYVFIECSKPNALMGDRIEHVDYVKKHLGGGCVITEEEDDGDSNAKPKKPSNNKSAGNVRVDTKMYIQNQLMKPCTQLLSIALEQLPGYVYDPKLSGPAAVEAHVTTRETLKTAKERLDGARENRVEALLFDPIIKRTSIRQRDNRCKGQQEIDSFFNKSPASASSASSASTSASSSKKITLPIDNDAGSQKQQSSSSPVKKTATKQKSLVDWLFVANKAVANKTV